MHLMERAPSLDLVRGLAAFVVAIAHFFIYRHIRPDIFETLSVLAVEVFFVLSGFVLAPQIIACVQAGKVRSLGIFFVRRWMRTIPAFILALVCISAISSDLHIGDMARYALYVQNLFSQSNQVDYYPVAWSLSVEEWFYVVFPLLLFSGAVVCGRPDLKVIAIITVLFITAISVLRWLEGDYAHWGSEIRRVVAFRIDSIAYGVLLFLMLGSLARQSTRPVLIVIGFVLFVGIAAFAFQLTLEIALKEEVSAEHIFPFAAALFGSSIIILFWLLDSIVRRSRRLKETALCLGRISYSVYLIHLIFLVAGNNVLGAIPVQVASILYLLSLIPSR
jgi:peptidoglycan/LPS O-acetylase OafA/YrhL